MSSGSTGAIGYVEYAYVLQNKMTYALLQNAAGEFMAPSIAALPGRRRLAPTGRTRRISTW